MHLLDSGFSATPNVPWQISMAGSGCKGEALNGRQCTSLSRTNLLHASASFGCMRVVGVASAGTWGGGYSRCLHIMLGGSLSLHFSSCRTDRVSLCMTFNGFFGTDAGLLALGGILRLHYAAIFPFVVTSAGSIIRSFPCRFVISLF